MKFRVVELKTPRFSTAIGSNLYAEDRVEYFSVFLVASILLLLLLLLLFIYYATCAAANKVKYAYAKTMGFSF